MIKLGKLNNFFNLINFIGTDEIKFYQAPSLSDKMILLNVIATCLNDFCNFSTKSVNNMCIKLSEIYNQVNFTYSTKSIYNPISILKRDEELLKSPTIKNIADNLTFTSYIIQSNKPTMLEKLRMNVQIFTFASVFMNMDKLLDQVINYLQSINE